MAQKSYARRCMTRTRSSISFLSFFFFLDLDLLGVLFPTAGVGSGASASSPSPSSVSSTVDVFGDAGAVRKDIACFTGVGGDVGRGGINGLSSDGEGNTWCGENMVSFSGVFPCGGDGGWSNPSRSTLSTVGCTSSVLFRRSLPLSTTGVLVTPFGGASGLWTLAVSTFSPELLALEQWLAAFELLFFLGSTAAHGVLVLFLLLAWRSSAPSFLKICRSSFLDPDEAVTRVTSDT